MAELYVNVNGTWKTASNYYVNVNGTWKEGRELHAMVSSAWKESSAGSSGLITTNLVLHLDAGNSSSYSGSGTAWNDLSGNGNNFTLTNGPTYTSDNGGAIVFDGTNDYAVSALNQAFFQFGTGDYSYGVWVKIDNVVNSFEAVMSSGSSSENGRWGIDLYFNNRFRHILKDNSGGNLELSTNTLSNWTSDWFYLVVVNDRSENNLKFYVNGTLNKSATDTKDTFNSGTNTSYGSTDVGNFSSATAVTNAFNIATNNSQNKHMDGTIAQVHVYKGKALTASEVLANYNATKANYI